MSIEHALLDFIKDHDLASDHDWTNEDLTQRLSAVIKRGHFHTYQDDNGHNVYHITGLGDFSRIPPDRLQDCLKDFTVAVQCTAAMSSAVEHIFPGLNLDPEILQQGFIWIDDGIFGNIEGLEIKQYADKPNYFEFVNVGVDS